MGTGIQLWVLPEHRLVVRQMVGPVTVSQAIETAVAALDHPDYRPGFVTIQDNRLAHVQFSGAELRRVADALQLRREELTETGRMALLLDSPLAWGITRMAGVIFEGVVGELRPFRDLAEAKAWLELPADLRLPFE